MNRTSRFRPVSRVKSPLLRWVWKACRCCDIKREIFVLRMMNPVPAAVNTLRLSPVIGRKKQMIKFKGTTLFAPALFDLTEWHGRHRATMWLKYFPMKSEPMKYCCICCRQITEESDHRIRSYLQAKLRVTPQIRYVSAKNCKNCNFLGRKETGEVY